MQAPRTVQLVSVRYIALAFALLVALLLASAAGYVIRGGIPTNSSTVAPAPLHVQQQTDNQMQREHDRNLDNRHASDSEFGFGP